MAELVRTQYFIHFIYIYYIYYFYYIYYLFIIYYLLYLLYILSRLNLCSIYVTTVTVRLWLFESRFNPNNAYSLMYYNSYPLCNHKIIVLVKLIHY